MKQSSWVGIDISCDDRVAEELAAEVADAFGVGVEIGGAYVRFYLEGNELLEEQELKLRSLLDDAAKTYHTDGPLGFKTFPLSDEGWADSWKVHFKPFRIGKHFLICPSWENYLPEAGDRVIMMDPGRAFGTGHHETTRLCLEWMERWAEDRDVGASSLLDVGTGSGVLAIAAALLGFGKVVGIDNDPEAIEVAAENVALNGLNGVNESGRAGQAGQGEQTGQTGQTGQSSESSGPDESSGRLALAEATVSGLAGRFDVVVSNIQALPLIRMAEELGERVKESGRLVLSGILLEQRQDVTAAYERCGLKLVESGMAGEWALLVFEKRGKVE